MASKLAMLHCRQAWDAVIRRRGKWTKADSWQPLPRVKNEEQAGQGPRAQPNQLGTGMGQAEQSLGLLLTGVSPVGLPCILGRKDVPTPSLE